MSTGEPPFGSEERVLVLLPDRNSPPKRDWSGTFLPEAKALVAALAGPTGHQAVARQIPVPAVDPTTLTIGSKAKQRAFEAAAARVIEEIDQRSWTRIVLLCHGWATGLQLGFRTAKQKGNDAESYAALVASLRRQTQLRSLTLFACSAGDEPGTTSGSARSGDLSIADDLRDRAGVPVLAHWSVGHTTRNPDLILFEASPAPLLGGTVVAQRGTALYRNALRLLTGKKDPKTKKIPGDVPPRGHSRTARHSLPLCGATVSLQALLSSTPGI